jgi:hypothetical protein
MLANEIVRQLHVCHVVMIVPPLTSVEYLNICRLERGCVPEELECTQHTGSTVKTHHIVRRRLGVENRQQLVVELPTIGVSKQCFTHGALAIET